MLFSDVLAQDKTKDMLISSAREKRVPHARLFIAPEGAGALPLALAYAQFLNCKEPSENEPCGKCSSCIKYQKLQHPDLHFVFPVPKQAANKVTTSDLFLKQWIPALTQNPYMTLSQWNAYIENTKEAAIYVDEAQEIIRKLSFRAYEAKYKVMIIWMAERMNVQTSNKILKILEEPYPQTLFFLIAESANSILPTILSRTQILRIPKIPAESIAAYLSEKRLTTPERAYELALSADGNLSRALDIAKGESKEENYFRLFQETMRTAWQVYSSKNKMLELVNSAAECAKLSKDQQKSLLLYFLRIVRANLILNQKIETQSAALSREELEFCGNFSKFIPPETATKFYEALNLAIQHLEANANPKILFLDLFCKFVIILKH